MSRPIAVLLAGVVALGTTLASELATPLRGAGSPAPAAPGPATGLIPAAPAASPAVQLATILGRPLFDERRRPPALPASPPPAAPAPVAVRLSGVLVATGQRSAIFAVAGSPRAVVAQEGGHVGAFTVQAISAGQVTLRGPDGTAVLRPTHDPTLAPPEFVPLPAPHPVPPSINES